MPTIDHRQKSSACREQVGSSVDSWLAGVMRAPQSGPIKQINNCEYLAGQNR